MTRCVELLRRGNIRGVQSEIIRAELLRRARKVLPALAEAIRAEGDEHIRRILLEVVAESRLPEAISVLAENFFTPNGQVRGCCITALRAIGMEEARRALAEKGWS